MKLIDKDALVAEIEKLKLCTMDEHMNYYSAEAQGEYNALSKLESFLDALEVKEVDLEKIIEQTYYDRSVTDTADMDYVTYENIANHFFELGLSVSNSTKVTTPDIDDILKKWCVNPYSKEAKIIKESYFMAIEKLAQKGEEV